MTESGKQFWKEKIDRLSSDQKLIKAIGVFAEAIISNQRQSSSIKFEDLSSGVTIAIWAT